MFQISPEWNGIDKKSQIFSVCLKIADFYDYVIKNVKSHMRDIF